MGWFEGSKKLNIPGFAVNAFGKLPFYKEYLYICPDQAFSELKVWVDDRFERLSRQGAEPPYLAPNRHFMVHLPGSRTDLVGSIWDSNDGLRTFPFMIATALPRKVRKSGFPLFWQSLLAIWEYFERYYKYLYETGSAAAFYKGIRGVVHQIPKVIEPNWPNDVPTSIQARERLQQGSFASFNLRSGDLVLENWLAGLKLREIPNFVLWPQSDFQTTSFEALGYLSMQGMEALALDLFQPTQLEGQARKDAEVLAFGATLAAEVDAQTANEDRSEEETLILGRKENQGLSKAEPVVAETEDGESREGDAGLAEGGTMNFPSQADVLDQLEANLEVHEKALISEETGAGSSSDQVTQEIELLASQLKKDDTLAMATSQEITNHDEKNQMLDHPSEAVTTHCPDDSDGNEMACDHDATLPNHPLSNEAADADKPLSVQSGSPAAEVATDVFPLEASDPDAQPPLRRKFAEEQTTQDLPAPANDEAGKDPSA